MKVVRYSDIEFIPASHEDRSNPGVMKKVLAKRNDLLKGRVQMINWAHLPIGKSFRAHYHEDLEEIFIILNGEVRITSGNKSEILFRGDTVVIPSKEIHSMVNTGKIDVDYVAIGISQGKNGKTIVTEDL